MTIFTNTLKRTSALTSALLLMTGTAMADQVFADDLIVQGSACIGIDCANGESFGFDTIRLKENNLRIKAQDTSTSASFPTVDWQLLYAPDLGPGRLRDELLPARRNQRIETAIPGRTQHARKHGLS